MPRDLSGPELASLLHRYGYSVVRQTGSHIRMTSTFKGSEHHVTVPAHHPLRVGTLGGIIADVAAYLEIDRSELQADLFG